MDVKKLKKSLVEKFLNDGNFKHESKGAHTPVLKKNIADRFLSLHLQGITLKDTDQYQELQEAIVAAIEEVQKLNVPEHTKQPKETKKKTTKKK